MSEYKQGVFHILGTVINLKVYGVNAEIAISQAVERLNEIDDRMSFFKDYSDICRINDNAGEKFVAVSEDTYYLAKKAVEYSNILEGTFDPTIGPLVELWNFGKNNGIIPQKADIKNKLQLVNYRDILFDEQNEAIKLKNKNQKIDFGGIAKGFAADEVKNIFDRNGIKSAIINLGGNIFVVGQKDNATPWRVGIQNPEGARDEFIGIVSVQNKSIVTSGNYERYFIKDGKRYHHIIDPRTGFPSESKIVSATIVSDKSIDGDGLSTGTYILGLNKAVKLIESLNGIDAIFITEDRKVYATSGIKKDFILI